MLVSYSLEPSIPSQPQRTASPPRQHSCELALHLLALHHLTVKAVECMRQPLALHAHDHLCAHVPRSMLVSCPVHPPFEGMRQRDIQHLQHDPSRLHLLRLSPSSLICLRFHPLDPSIPSQPQRSTVPFGQDSCELALHLLALSHCIVKAIESIAQSATLHAQHHTSAELHRPFVGFNKRRPYVKSYSKIPLRPMPDCALYKLHP